jgi:hypothetical protein
MTVGLIVSAFIGSSTPAAEESGMPEKEKRSLF